MRETFSSYLRPSEDEFNKLWKECLFVFDTNVLLGLYSYSPKTRKELFEVLHKISSRIWIPHQVALEFLRRRPDVALKPMSDLRKERGLLDIQLKNTQWGSVKSALKKRTRKIR